MKTIIIFLILNVQSIKGPGVSQGRGLPNEIVAWTWEEGVGSDDYEDMDDR